MEDFSNEIYIMYYWDAIKDYRPNLYLKVGVSGKGKSNSNSRAKDLSGTIGPIKVVCQKAWDLGGDATKAEKMMHKRLETHSAIGEWFEDTEDFAVFNSVCSDMELVCSAAPNIKEIDLDKDDKVNKKMTNEQKDFNKEARTKRTYSENPIFFSPDECYNLLSDKTFSIKAYGVRITTTLNSDTMMTTSKLGTGEVFEGSDPTSTYRKAYDHVWSLPGNGSGKMSADFKAIKCEETGKKVGAFFKQKSYMRKGDK